MPKTIFTGANKTVVDVVREARVAAGLRQSDLAKLVGKDQSWVSLIESSQRRLDVVEFIVIAKALDVDPAVLLNAIAKKLPTNPSAGE